MPILPLWNRKTISEKLDSSETMGGSEGNDETKTGEIGNIAVGDTSSLKG